MDKAGDFLYRYAARLIVAAVFFAFVSFSIGAFYLKGDQASFFKAAELFVWAAGLISILLVRKQLRAQEVILEAHRHQQEQAFEQMLEDHKWKCYAFYHQHFPEVPSEDLRKKVYQIAASGTSPFVECFDGRGSSIPDASLNAIRGTAAEWESIRPYLDCFEVFCGAINARLVDEDYAFSLQATRVVRNYAVFEPLINLYKKGSPTAYCEFHKVAYRWRLRLLPNESYIVEGLGIDGKVASPISAPRRRSEPERAEVG